MERRRWVVREGVRPRKFVEDLEEEEDDDDEGLMSELYIGRVSEEGGSSSTGEGSSSCIGIEEMDPREVAESRGGRSGLDDILMRSPSAERGESRVCSAG